MIEKTFYTFSLRFVEYNAPVKQFIVFTAS